MTDCFRWVRNSQMGIWFKSVDGEGISKVWLYEYNFQLFIRVDNWTINRVNIRDYFLDVHNPSKNELSMFQLQYGIDLTIPLTSKENHDEQNN